MYHLYFCELSILLNVRASRVTQICINVTPTITLTNLLLIELLLWIKEEES